MEPLSTRRFEMGLPFLADLDLGAMVDAQNGIKRGDLRAISLFVGSLGAAGKLKVFRKLAAVAKATELELKAAEGNPKLLTEMEAAAAEAPFEITFGVAIDFFWKLLERVGISHASSLASQGGDTSEAMAGASGDSPSGD